MMTTGQELDPAKRLRIAWGTSIRQMRKLKGWTLAEFSQRLEDDGYPVSSAAIGMWERGVTAPRWHHQAAVARALDVPRAVLFAITDEVA